MKGKIDKIILKWQLGSIRTIYRDAVEIAKMFDCAHVQFPFNGVNVVVNSWCDLELNNDDWNKISDAIGDKTEIVYL